MDVKPGRVSNTIRSSHEEEEDDAMMDLRRGPWTVEEDLALMNYIANHGEGRWNSLARCAGNNSKYFYHIYNFSSTFGYFLSWLLYINLSSTIAGKQPKNKLTMNNDRSLNLVFLGHFFRGLVLSLLFHGNGFFLFSETCQSANGVLLSNSLSFFPYWVV